MSWLNGNSGKAFKQGSVQNRVKADGKQEMYGRSGFKTFIFDDYQLVAKAKLITDDTGLESIREYSEQDFDKLAEYDRKISPYDRTHLLDRAQKKCQNIL